MNTHLSKHIERELRIGVERIVRPITASTWRKDRMREELLVHLIQTYKAEQAKSSLSNDPLADAIKRLGDPSLVRESLQQSVPKWEQLLFAKTGHMSKLERWLFKKSMYCEDQPVWRNTLRYMLYQAVLPMLAALCVIFPIVNFLPGRSIANGIAHLDAVVATFVIWIAMVGLFAALSHPVYRAMTRSGGPRWARLIGCSALWCLAALAVALAQWTIVNNWQFVWVYELSSWLIVGVLSVFPFLVCVMTYHRRIEREHRWLTLDLTESA